MLWILSKTRCVLCVHADYVIDYSYLKSWPRFELARAKTFHSRPWRTKDNNWKITIHTSETTASLTPSTWRLSSATTLNQQRKNVVRYERWGCSYRQSHRIWLNPLKGKVSTGYTLPPSSNLHFNFWHSLALWRSALSARVPECQKLKL